MYLKIIILFYFPKIHRIIDFCSIMVFMISFFTSSLKHLGNYMVGKQSMEWAMMQLNLQDHVEAFMRTA